MWWKNSGVWCFYMIKHEHYYRQNTTLFNKTDVFGEVGWLYRIVYKPHSRFADGTASFTASKSTNQRVRWPSTAISNKTIVLLEIVHNYSAFGEVCWLYRIVYKPHTRFGHEAASFSASTSWNDSVSWQKPAICKRTGAFGDICWLYRIMYKLHARFDDETAFF